MTSKFKFDHIRPTQFKSALSFQFYDFFQPGHSFYLNLTYKKVFLIPITFKTFARYPNFVKLQKLRQIPPQTILTESVLVCVCHTRRFFHLVLPLRFVEFLDAPLVKDEKARLLKIGEKEFCTFTYRVF